MKRFLPVVLMMAVGALIYWGGPKLLAAFTPDEPDIVSIELKDRGGHEVLHMVFHKNQDDKNAGTLIVTGKDGRTYQFEIQKDGIEDLVKKDEKGNVAITLTSL